MKPLIYHNPKCGSSRNALAMIKASGEEPTIIEYLKNPPTREQLLDLIEQMAITPRDLLRNKDKLYEDLVLDDPSLSNDKLIDAMMAHPILINRPIVVTDKGARLCRPPELVLGLLASPVTTFTKENGTVVTWPEAEK